jgi:colicin import membrane protein
MIRKHEATVSWKAGALAAMVHLCLLAAMLISISWKEARPVLNVTEVELWDKLPAPKVVEEPKPQPKSAIKEESKPAPKPVVEEKPKPVEPKVDIELEKKKKELEQKEQAQKQKELDEQRKKEALDKIKQDTRAELERENKADDKKRKDALKKLQQEALSDEKAQDNKQASAANTAEKDAFVAKITAKIKSNVNKTLCGDGNPELKFQIGLLPTGQLSGNPKITKSSGNSACDDAVERAIMASEPLPLPSDPSLFSQFRNLNLIFHPNE